MSHGQAVDLGLILRPSQQRFVDAYIANGGNATQAWIEAGYTCANPKQVASKALASPKLRKAIIAQVERMHAAAMYLYPQSIRSAARYEAELDSIAFDKAQRARDRIQAIAVAAKLAGMVVDRVEVLSEDTIRKWAVRDGLDPDTMVGESRALIATQESEMQGTGHA